MKRRTEEGGLGFVANVMSAVEKLQRSRYGRRHDMGNIDGGKNINESCGYPDIIDVATYKAMYDREGLATKVVSIFPDECWQTFPVVKETLDQTEQTEFEKAWVTLEKKFNLNASMNRADTVSGVGHYGIMVLLFNDGQKLNKPVNGVTKGFLRRSNAVKLQLRGVRVYDESLINEITQWDTDPQSERYGMPIMYTVRESQDGRGIGNSTAMVDTEVHYTRVIHIADNKQSSEVYGTPRLRSVYNRMSDLRKILGGSAEMFWKGAFPGYVFEVDVDRNNFAGGVDVDKESIKAEFDLYQKDLQRILAVEGMSVKSLEVQIADPTAHVDTQMKVVAICTNVPLRIFLGSEEAKLASSEDSKRWESRVQRRRELHINPYIMRPLIDRLMAYGALPFVEDYTIDWVPIYKSSKQETATLVKTYADAFANFARYDAGTLMELGSLLELTTDLDKATINEVVFPYVEAMQRKNDNTPVDTVPVVEPVQEDTSVIVPTET